MPTRITHAPSSPSPSRRGLRERGFNYTIVDRRVPLDARSLLLCHPVGCSRRLGHVARRKMLPRLNLGNPAGSHAMTPATLSHVNPRKLGNTVLEVSPLCLGGNVFGWTIDEPTSFAVLDAFVDAGF